MIETLISSKTRIKLLLKFFLNSSTESYLRHLEQEFGESSNAIRIELNRLEEAGMLRSVLRSNRKYFKANADHPLFKEVHSILLKHVGIDQIIEHLARRLGQLHKLYLAGTFARGIDSQVVDLVLVGQIDLAQLSDMVGKAELLIGRKIRCIVFAQNEVIDWKSVDPQCQPMLLWTFENPTTTL